jgi:hypothetical protein
VPGCRCLQTSDANKGSASLRMRKMCSSWVGKLTFSQRLPTITTLQSSSPLHLRAVAARAPEIWIVGNGHMAAPLADKPARPLQHRPVLIAQHAIRTTYDLLSQWTLFLMRTAQYLTSAWPRPWYEKRRYCRHHHVPSGTCVLS